MNNKMTSVQKGHYGEKYVNDELIKRGIDAKWYGNYNPADFILSNGKTIDVKYSSSPISAGIYNLAWRFNLHHHGILQTGIDYYICIIYHKAEITPFILPGRFINKYSIRITSKDIKNGIYDKYKDNWDLLNS